MKLFYTDIFELPLPEKHRFPMAKYRRLRERLAEQFPADCFHVPPAATDDELLLAHTAEYLEKLIAGKLTEREIRRIGFPWSPEMVERSRRSTGATTCAARAALHDGVAANLAGGTHHAFADSGEGYCVFNDTCVAARVLLREKLVEKVLIVDCDVHQGNGTAEITRRDSAIYAFSMHCEQNFPFRKRTSHLDIALPAGAGDELYLQELQRGISLAMQQSQPDFVFYIAGADPFYDDRLGKLRLTKRGLQERDQLVFQSCRDHRLPVAVSMAGGYAQHVDDIVDIHFATVMTGWQICGQNCDYSFTSVSRNRASR